jgi:hypothetical protein
MLTFRVLIVVGLLTVAAGFSRSAEESAAPDAVSAEQKWLQALFQQDASQYEFSLDEKQTRPLKFVDKPVFHWKQDDDWWGDVFVWTYQGRPEIVGCVLASDKKGESRTIAHEFHTLAFDPLPTVPTTAGSWQAKEGVSLLPMADAPKPAATEGLRLTQLRKLAREFTVSMEHEGQPWELRLLPQPLYRYSSPKRGVIDGAIFAYVWTKGTDPEFLLMLECRKGQPDPTWSWIPARFTTRALTVTRGDEQVWTCPSAPGWTQGDRFEPYMSFFSRNVTVPTESPRAD